MMRFVPKFDPSTGLRNILLLQLVMAGVLVASDAFNLFPAILRDKVELPSGPISPGDQRRVYRTDRPNPDLLKLDGPLELPLPERFADRLEFFETSVDDIGEVLLVSGQIETGDAERFVSHLEDMQAKPKIIALHSPGGVVFEALEIGREVRKQELVSAVFAGSFCLSSCPYILAGGEERIVSRSAVVGLHQMYYDQPKLLPVVFAIEDIQMGQGEAMEFLIEMGVDPSMTIYSLKTPPEQIYALVEDELSETRIATKIVD